MTATRAERLLEFRARLAAAKPARSFEEAFGQITRILNEVEDDLSGVPYDIAAAGTDGRLYPPLWDNMNPESGRPQVWSLRSRGHVTRVGENGSITIEDSRTGQTFFNKAGEDGREVDQL